MNSCYEDTLLVRKHSEDRNLGTFLRWVERCEMMSIWSISLQMFWTIIGNKHHLFWHNIPQLMPCSPQRSCTRPLGPCKSTLGCCPWMNTFWLYPVLIYKIRLDLFLDITWSPKTYHSKSSSIAYSKMPIEKRVRNYENCWGTGSCMSTTVPLSTFWIILDRWPKNPPVL